MTGQLATSILPEDRITVNLVAHDKTGKRVNIGHIFNGSGQQIEASGAPFNGDSRDLQIGSATPGNAVAPFDTERFLDLIRQNKKAEADEMTLEYYDLSTDCVEMSVSDALAESVYQFCAAEYGLKEQDHDGFVLSRREIIVSAPFRSAPDAPALWVVSLTPKWG